jgi:hypothetical protein
LDNENAFCACGLLLAVDREIFSEAAAAPFAGFWAATCCAAVGLLCWAAAAALVIWAARARVGRAAMPAAAAALCV